MKIPLKVYLLLVLLVALAVCADMAALWLALGIALLMPLSGLGVKSVLAHLRRSAWFIAVVALSPVFLTSSGDAGLAGFPPIFITGEGLLQGAAAGARVAAMFMLSLWLLKTMPMPAVIEALGALSRRKGAPRFLPSRDTVVMTLLALQLTPLLLEEAERQMLPALIASWRSRRGVLDKVRETGALLPAFFIALLRRGQEWIESPPRAQ